MYILNNKFKMAQTNPNIFNPGSSNDTSNDNSEFDFNLVGIETIPDDDARNKVRANIYKALTCNENLDESSIMNATYPPNILAMKLEDELINEFKKSDSTTYKSSSSSVIKRLTGPRFAEARKILCDGEFPLIDFIKGKTPKPQKKSTIKEDDNQPKDQTSAQVNPVNRSRGVRPPPMANVRGGRGGPPQRGAPRGTRGSRGMPLRGGISQTADPASRSLISDLQIEVKETVSEEEECQESNEETKQQPAIQIPKENAKEIESNEDKTQSKRIEAETENNEPKEKVIIPSIRQVEKSTLNTQINQSIPPVGSVDVQGVPNVGGPPKMPKINTRRGQPTLGPHNVQPPAMNRGRGYRDSSVVADVEDKTPIFNQQIIHQEESKERIEIHEDEIIHDGEQLVENVEEEKVQKQSIPPTATKQQSSIKNDDFRKGSEDVINFDKTENK